MDKGHNQADEQLEKMGEEIARIFDTTTQKAVEKLKKYLKKFESEMEQNEDMTDSEFRRWAINRITNSKEWKKLREELVTDYENATSQAMHATGAGLLSVYFFNNKYFTKYIKDHSKKKRKVNVREKPRRESNILPKKKPESISRAWHRRKIENVIRNGMKKGESIDKIARRIEVVSNMDVKAAYRTARTGVTCAENEARIDAMYEAQKSGIDSDKIWIATLDDRTRTSHRVIHGERVPWDEYFSNGLFEPADPDGDDEEVYNCRCTLGWVEQGMEYNVKDSPTGMGRLEWQGKKPVSKPFPKKRRKK